MSLPTTSLDLPATSSDTTTARRLRSLLPTGMLAGAAAAAATVVVAASAQAADVSLEVDGKAIPLTALKSCAPAGGGRDVCGRALCGCDKFAACTCSGGEAERALTRDEMLDDIALCCLTNTRNTRALEHDDIAKVRERLDQLQQGHNIEPARAVALTSIPPR